MGNIFHKRRKKSRIGCDTPNQWYSKWNSSRVEALLLFKKLDTNNDGVVKGRELKKLASDVRSSLGPVNPSLSGRLGKKIMLRHDTDRNRGLGEYEFMQWYTTTMPAMEMFVSLDVDNSGFLKGPEMKELSSRLQGTENPSFIRLGRKIMEKADKNKDNRLDLDEYLDWTTSSLFSTVAI